MTTDPVISTAPAPIETSIASPASASVAARSIASARSGTTLTRSSPKTSTAARPRVAAVALGFVVPAMFGLGAVFAALWAGADLLGRKIERERAAAWAAYDAEQSG